MKKLISIIAMALATMSASAYDLTISAPEQGKGEVTFKVNGSDVTTADEGETVTVVVTGGKGWISSSLTARGYTGFDAAQARRTRAASLPVIDWLTVTTDNTAEGTYTFTMPAADVVVYPTYDHRALTNDMVEAIADQTWTGQAITPTLVVKDRDYTLVAGEDYNVTYANNTDKGLNTATATVTPITEGNDDYYLGTASVTFSIRKDISNVIAYVSSTGTYTGDSIKLAPTVKDGRNDMIEGVDYTVAYSDNVNSGMATFTLTGIGTYQGTRTGGGFFIQPRSVRDAEFGALAGITYSGSAQYPSLSITYNGKTLVEGNEDGSDAATCDYYTTYLNNTETGEAMVIIEGMNNFTDKDTLTFNIDAKPLTEDMIAAIADLTYDGNAKEPAPTVTYNGMTLNAGTDYTVTYADNTNAGTATLTITSTATNTNYTGSAQKTFTIRKANVNVTAKPTAKTGLVYNAQAQSLVNAGTVEGGELQYSVDGGEWTSTVSTATDADTYTVEYKVVGDQNHNDVDATSIEVTIGKASLTTMALAEATLTYNKKEQTVQVSSVSAGTLSVAATDYDVTGNKQTNVGQYTATVTAKETSVNFTGSVTAQYSIVEADAKVFTLAINPESFVYNGQAQVPSVTVKDGDDVLSENKDYTLAFESNVNAGTAKVTATGKGNYKNTQEKTFTIQKANAKLGTAPAALTLTYNTQAQALASAGAITKVGTTDESKLQYSIDGKNFSDEVPTATDAGSYTISYFVLGDANHNNTDTLTVDCAIQKDQGTMVFTDDSYSLTYGDASFTNAITEHGDNDIRFVSNNPLVAEVNYYTGVVNIKGIGDATITAMMQEHKNYKKQATDITYPVSVAALEVKADDVTVGEAGENGVPEITVSIEAGVGTLTPEEGSDYQLTYYDNDNPVTVEQMVATPGEYVAVLTFYGNYAGFVEKAITVEAATQGVLPGDVNANDEVELDDLDAFTTNMLNNEIPTEAGTDDFIRHDANEDGRIDIADAQAIINLAMGLNADGSAKTAAARQLAPATVGQASMSVARTDMGDGVVRYDLSIVGNVSYTGFQADVVTDGRIVSESLTASTMHLRSNTMSNGKHRILALPGTGAQQADGVAVRVFVIGGESLSFENVVLTTAEARSIAVGGETTSIDNISGKTAEQADAYDLNGRKVSGAKKGIVIVGGKKVVLK